MAVVKDVATDPRIEYTKEAIAEGIKSMLSVGLMIRNEPIGALSVYIDRHRLFAEEQIQIFKGIANEAAAVIERARLYEEYIENQLIEQELSIAAEVQVNLMPREKPQFPGIELAVRNIPSRIIGGDFYDFIPFDESHMGIVIADVSGKGIPGAILMASARATLRAYLEEPHSVKGVITKLNRVLCRDTRSEQFVSLFYGMLDIKEQTITYVNAGHNSPILLRNHEKSFLEEGGPILGFLEDAPYEERELQLLAGDVVLFYTDGITEAEREGEYFGVRRLLKLVRADMSKSPEEMVEKVLEEVAKFSSNAPQVDDKTIIILKRESI